MLSAILLYLGLLAQSMPLSLYDGTSLDGWFWSHEANPPTPSWVSNKGILATSPGKGKEVYLLTKKSFEDFDFSFEWRAEPRANSGVKYRIQEYGNSSSRIEPVGLEYQITDDEANPDALSSPRHSAGALYDYVAPAKSRPALPNVWHQSRILVRGLHLEHWLDGEKVVDTNFDSPAAAASFNLSKRESRHMLRKQEKRQSPIALQIHDGVVEFRSLVIRQLN